MTKEELNLLMGTVRLAFKQLTRGRSVFLIDETTESTVALEKIQAEFNRYIDVLEPVRQHPCFYAITNYMAEIDDDFVTSEHAVEWSIIAGIVSKAVYAVSKERKGVRTRYCPHCGKGVE